MAYDYFRDCNSNATRHVHQKEERKAHGAQCHTQEDPSHFTTFGSLQNDKTFGNLHIDTTFSSLQIDETFGGDFQIPLTEIHRSLRRDNDDHRQCFICEETYTHPLSKYDRKGQEPWAAILTSDKIKAAVVTLLLPKSHDIFDDILYDQLVCHCCACMIRKGMARFIPQEREWKYAMEAFKTERPPGDSYEWYGQGNKQGGKTPEGRSQLCVYSLT